MGLDITAYSHLTPIAYEIAFDVEDDIRDGYIQLPTNDHYPHHAGEMTRDRIYKYDQSFGFNAGSYTGYKWWRDGLASMAGYGSAKNVWESNLTGPFTELINFSDCEGTIGWQFAAKLAKDFADFDLIAARSNPHLAGAPDFYPWYKKWQQAFALAAQDGAVRFH
jgi:hypothetical protein